MGNQATFPAKNKAAGMPSASPTRATVWEFLNLWQMRTLFPRLSLDQPDAECAILNLATVCTITRIQRTAADLN